MSGRQLAQPLPLFGVQPGGDEVREPRSGGVDHAERRVARVDQLTRGVDQRLEHVVERVRGGEGDAGLDQPSRHLAFRPASSGPRTSLVLAHSLVPPRRRGHTHTSPEAPPRAPGSGINSSEPRSITRPYRVLTVLARLRG